METHYKPEITDYPALQIVPVEETPPTRIEELSETVTELSITPEVVESVWPNSNNKGEGSPN